MFVRSSVTLAMLAAVGGCGAGIAVEDGQEALDVSLTPVGGSIGGTITPRCVGSAPRCACATGRAACFGTSWVCIYPAESCNGVDDDCDGLVDEGGDALCDDRLSCTTDRCQTLTLLDPFGRPAGGTTSCVHGLANAACDDRVSCTEDLCKPDDASHDAAGCVHRPKDEVCSDGCNCTGREVCDPGRPGANPTTGCASGRAPCERDNNVCTLNACCEQLSAACRARFSADELTRIDQACGIAGGDVVAADTGATVRCPAFSTARDCDDDNPCTADWCDTLRGCGHTAVADGTLLSTREQGCVLEVCRGGRPLIQNVSEDDYAIRGLPRPACGNDATRDTCMRTRCRPLDAARPWGCYLDDIDSCNDGIFCNGYELCLAQSGAADYTMPDGSAPLAGCRRDPFISLLCNDKDPCTTDTCVEATQSCTHALAPSCDLF